MFYRICSVNTFPSDRAIAYLEFCRRRHEYLEGKRPQMTRAAMDHDLYAYHVPEYRGA